LLFTDQEHRQLQRWPATHLSNAICARRSVGGLRNAAPFASNFLMKRNDDPAAMPQHCTTPSSNKASKKAVSEVPPGIAWDAQIQITRSNEDFAVA
jgi:hypothetical protein